MKRDVQPFLVPAEESISATPWMRFIEGEWELLGESVENWDYRTSVRLKCAVYMDETKVREQTGLTDGSPLSLVFGQRAVETYLTGPITSLPMQDGLSDVEISLDPANAGATVSLSRRLVLMRDRLAAGPGEAQHAGSILWGDDHRVRLTGDTPMFPTEVVDFEAFGLDPNASWHALLPASPDAPAMGALLLLLNEKDTKLVSAVQRERRLTDEQAFLVDQMEENLVLEIVRWALTRWDELSDSDDQSFGASARALTTRILPEPEAWTTDAITTGSMELRTVVVGRARTLGFGRHL